jgi:hypothetical protein
MAASNSPRHSRQVVHDASSIDGDVEGAGHHLILQRVAIGADSLFVAYYDARAATSQRRRLHERSGANR